MNYSNTKEPDIVIDLKDLLWNLLARWKILFILGIIMALLVGGFMYLRTDREYQAALQAQEKAKSFASLSAEERAAKVMEEYQLSDDDQKVIRYLVKQQEIVKSMQEYLYGSLLMNLNPSNQRIMSLTYYIKGTDADLQALVDGYNFYLHRETILRQLGDVISPGTDVKYIYELVDSWNGDISDSDATGIDFTVKIVLPEDADASAVEEVVTRILRKGRAEVSRSIGEHTISLINKEDINRYNTEAVDRRTGVTNNINNLQNNIQNFRAKLSPEQMEAMNEVSAIYNGTDNAAASSGDGSQTTVLPEKPGLSLKYLVVGFLLGIILYAGYYVVRQVLRRRITTAGNLATISSSRNLGEIGCMQSREGLRNLTHSKLVDRIRYRKAVSQKEEIDGAISSIAAVCERENVDDLHILQMLSEESTGVETAKQVCDRLKEEGCNLEVIDLSDSVNEKTMLPVKNVVFMAEEGSSIDALWRISQICRQFDVNVLGSVYLEQR